MKTSLSATHCKTAGQNWLRIVIIKSDHFAAQKIRENAARAFPRSKIVVCHAGADALTELRRQPAQLALTGLSLPDMDGLDLIITIKREHLAHGLLVISGRRDERSCELLHDLHIGHLNPTGEDSGALQDAIRITMEGRPYAGVGRDGSATAGRNNASTQDKQDNPSLNTLTLAELRVFLLIASGLDEKQVADRLRKSKHTAHSHLRHAMSKLGLHSQAQVMREALRRGCIRHTSRGFVYPGFNDVLAGNGSLRRHRAGSRVNNPAAPGKNTKIPKGTLKKKRQVTVGLL